MRTKEEIYATHAGIAVCSPRRILLHPRFWTGHLEYFGLLAGVSALTGWLIPIRLFKVSPELLNNPGPDIIVNFLGSIFLLLIGAVSLWAVSTSVGALAEVMVDSSIAAVIEMVANKKLERLRRTPGVRIDFGVLNQLLPRNTTKPEPAMIRFAMELLKDARNLRFDSRFYLLQRYRSESSNYVFQLERLQKYALRLGILGTFVGLIFALKSFVMILPSATSESPTSTDDAQLLIFDSGSRDLLNSLRLSFGTSIAGLAASLFIAGQAEFVRRRQSRYFRHMEDASLSLVTLAGRTIHREDLLASLEDNTRAMKELQIQVYDQTQKLEGALAALDQRIANQTTEIEAGMLRLTEAREGLDGFLEQIEYCHSHFLSDLSTSLERLIGRLNAALGGLGEGLAEELRVRANQVVEEFEVLLQRVGSSHAQFLTDLTALFEKAALDQFLERLPESIIGLGERIASDVGSGFVLLGRNLKDLCGKIAAIERELATTAQDLTGKTSLLQSKVQSIDSQIASAVEESRRAMEEVPPVLRSLQRKVEGAKIRGLVVLDAAVFKRVLLGSAFGLLVGVSFESSLVAVAGAIIASFLLLTIFGSRGGQ